MEDMKSKAKLDVLKRLRKDAMDDMGQSYDKGMKKVSVVSPTKEGLAKGLDKAEDLLKQIPTIEGSPAQDDEGAYHDQKKAENFDESLPDHEDKKIMEDMSPEEIDCKIEELMEIKRRLKPSQMD